MLLKLGPRTASCLVSRLAQYPTAGSSSTLSCHHHQQQQQKSVQPVLLQLPRQSLAQLLSFQRGLRTCTHHGLLTTIRSLSGDASSPAQAQAPQPPSPPPPPPSSSSPSSSPLSKSEEQAKIEEEAAEKEKQRARQKKFTKYTLMGMIVAFSGSTLYAFFNWGQPEVDPTTGAPVIDQFSHLPFVTQYASRAWATFMHYEKVLKEPTRELLLPPPLPPPYYQPPYTLVLEMTGVLVHPEWTYKTGWRFKKRPFVDYFLHQCASSANFELVIYTHEQGFTAFPLLNSLDPNGYIMYRLFRDSTRYEGGVHVKDLNCLNRDLRTVIHVDWNEKACALNPDNCLKLKKWDGDSENDRTLYDLAHFLMALSNEKGQDVREVIRYYSQFDDPLEAFRENQRKLAEAEKERAEAAKQATPPYRSFLQMALRK